MATLYKDYNKDSKDLLTKNFTKAGEWKIENKAKAPKGDYAVGTTSNVRGDVTVDVEGLSADGACYGKLTLTPKDLQDIKATVRAENCHNHRIEGIIAHKGTCVKDVSVELNHQTVKPIAGGRLSVNDKVTEKAVELGLSLAAVDGVQLGCGAAYNLKSHTVEWTAACRLSPVKDLQVTVQTNELRSVAASAITVAKIHPKFSPKIGLNATMDVPSKNWDGSLVAEWGCQVLLGNTVKARVDKNLEWAVTYIAALKGSWTLALSFDKNMRTGLTLTRN